MLSILTLHCLQFIPPLIRLGKFFFQQFMPSLIPSDLFAALPIKDRISHGRQDLPLFRIKIFNTLRQSIKLFLLFKAQFARVLFLWTRLHLFNLNLWRGSMDRIYWLALAKPVVISSDIFTHPA